MHPSPAFAVEDRGAQMDFIRAHPFAMLSANGEGWPSVALAPLVVAEDGETLIGHVSRANPFWRAAKLAGQAVAVFLGPQAYVSPSLYPSKAEHGREVPTWNYLAVEVAGEIEVEEEAHAMRPYLDALTDRMEEGREHPWAVGDAPADYTEALQRGIVGFRLKAERMRMVQKTSQNKAAREYAAVRAAFIHSADPDEAALGAAMRPEK